MGHGVPASVDEASISRLHVDVWCSLYRASAMCYLTFSCFQKQALSRWYIDDLPCLIMFQMASEADGVAAGAPGSQGQMGNTGEAFTPHLKLIP